MKTNLSISPKSREPNGRESRVDQRERKGVSPAEVRRLRDKALIDIKDAHWGSMAGRLYLADKLKAHQYEAARRWCEAAKDYYEAIAAPGENPSPSPLELRSHAHPIDPDTERGQQEAAGDRNKVETFNRAKEVLLNNLPKLESLRFYLAFRRVIEFDEAPEGHRQLLDLSDGLERLAVHFGLLIVTKRRRR